MKMVSSKQRAINSKSQQSQYQKSNSQSVQSNYNQSNSQTHSVKSYSQHSNEGGGSYSIISQTKSHSNQSRYDSTQKSNQKTSATSGAAAGAGASALAKDHAKNIYEDNQQ
jgi:hypothetical protein